MSTTVNGFVDLNGRQVHAFASEVANVGYARLKDELLSMLRSGAWRDFKDGLGRYQFLPGEFDYFLSQWGVTRKDAMDGIADLDAKAELEQHMDERRTGEDDYRRRLTEVRAANPERPGRPIEPFGCTEAEGKLLVKGTPRAALGERVRRFAKEGTTKRPSEALPQVEKLRRSAMRLDDHDLADLIDSLKQEQRRRRRQA
jgi:hypothetical protein